MSLLKYNKMKISTYPYQSLLAYYQTSDTELCQSKKLLCIRDSTSNEMYDDSINACQFWDEFSRLPSLQ